MPRWLLARPYLHAGALGWINRHRRHRTLLPSVVVMLLSGAGLLTLPAVGAWLEIAAQNPILPFLVLAAGSAVLTARRKVSVYRTLSTSWLASLAAPGSVPVRMLFPPVLQLFLLTAVVGVPVLAGTLSRAGGTTLEMAVSAACAVGFVVGWFSPADKTIGAPDFHYVAIRRPRASWAAAPRLAPLSYWAVGQARVGVKPKATARALLLVLLAFPASSRPVGEKAIAVAAGAMVLMYLFALAFSAARIAVLAARWLAVTVVRYLPFTWALGQRVIAAQSWTCAWVVFFTFAVSVPMALRVGRGAVECVALTCVDIAVACWFAMKAAGMQPGLGEKERMSER